MLSSMNSALVPATGTLNSSPWASGGIVVASVLTPVPGRPRERPAGGTGQQADASGADRAQSSTEPIAALTMKALSAVAGVLVGKLEGTEQVAAHPPVAVDRASTADPSTGETKVSAKNDQESDRPTRPGSNLDLSV